MFLTSEVEEDSRVAMVLTTELITFLVCGGRLDRSLLEVERCLGTYRGQSLGVVWQKQPVQNNNELESLFLKSCSQS